MPCDAKCCRQCHKKRKKGGAHSQHTTKQPSERVALTLGVKASQEVEGVVGEESLVVEGVGQELGHGLAAHLLVVLLQVHLGKHTKNTVPSPQETESKNC